MTKEEALKIALSCLKSKTFDDGIIADIENVLNEEENIADEMVISKGLLIEMALKIVSEINRKIHQEHLDARPKRIRIDTESKEHYVSFIVTGKKNEVSNETSNQP